MNKSTKPQPKRERKANRQPVPYQLHNYRTNSILSWILSCILHVVLGVCVIFCPLPYQNPLSYIELEILKPKEKPTPPPVIKKEETTPQAKPEPPTPVVYPKEPIVPSKVHIVEKQPSTKPPMGTKPGVSGVKKASSTVTKPLVLSEKKTSSSADTANVEPYSAKKLEKAPKETDHTLQSNKEILGGELSGILDGAGDEQWLGDTLVNLNTAERTMVTSPDLRFLREKGFTSQTKMVKIQVIIAPDGTVGQVTVVFPGSGNPELDRHLKMAFTKVIFNDVREYGRKQETATIVLNFKG